MCLSSWFAVSVHRCTGGGGVLPPTCARHQPPATFGLMPGVLQGTPSPPHRTSRVLSHPPSLILEGTALNRLTSDSRHPPRATPCKGHTSRAWPRCPSGVSVCPSSIFKALRMCCLIEPLCRTKPNPKGRQCFLRPARRPSLNPSPRLPSPHPSRSSPLISRRIAVATVKENGRPAAPFPVV